MSTIEKDPASGRYGEAADSREDVHEGLRLPDILARNDDEAIAARKQFLPEFLVEAPVLLGPDRETLESELGGHILRNPKHTQALTIFDMQPGAKVCFYEFESEGSDQCRPYRDESGIIMGEPYFLYDSMWWVDLRKVDGSVEKRCLGILGVTLNYRVDKHGQDLPGEFNPYFCALRDV